MFDNALEETWDKAHSTILFVVLLMLSAAIDITFPAFIAVFLIAGLWVYSLSLKHLGDSIHLSPDPGIEKL